MKTIEEIKNEVAKKHCLTTWKHISKDDKAFLVDEVATEYAKQCCDEHDLRNKELTETLDYALKAINAVHSFGASSAIIKRIEGVLSHPNVVTTK